jgi:RNA polymerase sigma-70 factor (ECF subfamily)
MEPERKADYLLLSFLKKENRKLIGYIRNYIDFRFSEIEAEDILQEVILNLYSRADISVQVGNIAAYIYRSVHNRIVDLYRKKRNTVSLELLKHDKDGNLLMNTDKADEIYEPAIYEDESLQKKLREYIERLNPAERELIWRTDFEGCTHQELSEEWNIPLGTLLARRHRALGKLRRMIKEDILI